VLWIGVIFDADPDLIFHVFADPDLDTIPSFTHARKVEIFFHSSSSLHFLVSFIGVKIFNKYTSG
jgi:hypothetical protein